MRRKRTRLGSRRRSPDPEIWYTEPKKPGSKDERWRVNARTGKRERVRARRAKGSTVNTALAVKCPKWMEPDCEKCNVCGESADQVSFGITWGDGEELIRQSSAAGGGYRSRGPVLWAMHKLKSDAFELRHLDCLGYAPKYMGGPLAEKLPEYLVWSIRFGSRADIEIAIERARRAKVPDHLLYQVVPGGIAETVELIPF